MEEKFRKQLVRLVFWSTSMLRSQNSSSLLVTVSQFRHRVSLVKMPWSSLKNIIFISFLEIFPHLKYFVNPSWRGLAICLPGGFDSAAITGTGALFAHNDLIDVIDEKYEKLVCVLTMTQ